MACVNKTRAAFTNVNASAPNSGGDVSKSSQVRSTYFGMIQVRATGGCCVREGIGCRVVGIEVRGGLYLVLKRMSRLMTFTATGRSTAHTKCRNEVEDLERSVKLCGWAVADNEKQAGNMAADEKVKLLCNFAMPSPTLVIAAYFDGCSPWQP